MGDDTFPGNGSPKINKDYEIVKLKKKVEPGDPRLNLVERAFSAGATGFGWATSPACPQAKGGSISQP